MLRVYNTIFEHHDLQLAALAGLVCLLACYTAFSVMTRLHVRRAGYPWAIASAAVTGCGAWAAHSIALLAFAPGVPVAYDARTMVLAAAVAVAGSGIGFCIARDTEQMALGGAIVGFALSAMHYIGLAALKFQAQTHREVLYDCVAVLIGASFGAAALSRATLTPDFRGRAAAAIMLTLGIVGTYVFGMAGVTLIPDPNISIPQDSQTIVWFAIALTAVVLLIVGLGIFGVLLDQYFQEIDAQKRELENALQLADAASRSKTKFLSTMSHELRSPLNVIIGFSELLKKQPHGRRVEQLPEYVDTILSSGVHLLRLVNDILDISRFDLGQLHLNEEIVNIDECIKDCLNVNWPEAEKAGVRLIASVEKGLPRLNGDSRRIGQVLTNIISNGIRFTARGGEVQVSAFQKDGRLALRVADTGIGMPAQDIPKALERFGQLDSELNRKYDGAGLGLPLARNLMELHGGALHIESEPGVGTIVNALFPASRVVNRPALSQAAA